MKKYFLPILLALKKCYFEQVLLCDPANTVDFKKCYFEQVLLSYLVNTVDFEKVVLLSTSVTLTSRKNNKK